MHPFLFRILVALLSCSACALPAQTLSSPAAAAPSASVLSAAASNRWQTLAGTSKGLFGIDKDGGASALWQGGDVRKVLKAGGECFLLSERGIFASADLASWVPRNEGLPVKTLKLFDGKAKTFERVVQELKDLEADPANPAVMATAVKDGVYLSRDAGQHWTSLGFPGRASGVKAVAVVSLPETVVFASNPIYGVFYLEADKKGAKWTELDAGLALHETTEHPDEVSDILAAKSGADGQGEIAVWAAQTFKPNIYRLDWKAKEWKRVWSDNREFGTVESLDASPGGLRFVRDGGACEVKFAPAAPGTAGASAGPSALMETRPDLDVAVSRAARAIGSDPLCVYSDDPANARRASLSELWLLPGVLPPENPRKAQARGKEGLYLPVNHAADPKQLDRYLNIISNRNLNMVVVDMKDDAGRLRFAPKSPAIAAKGRVFNPVDLESFVPKMKSRGIWLVARVVVFKDPELAKWGGGKYAVWDSANNAPWQGTYTKKKPAAAATGSAAPSPAPAPAAPGAAAPAPAGAAPADSAETYTAFYDEHWVDPYSEEVWDYIAEIGRELTSRGFDEVQFDYIRFPTDGENLANARYRWRDPGMDMESAIMSFLGHVRSRIAAPISLDIYGANGWYRTGARTGQELELLSRYVDVVCPMYYPSHFEQTFLANQPAEQRPYRIYYRGTLRAERIARDRLVVRPYVQAFFLNVSYDRKFYGPDYVLRQLMGVRDAGAPGLTYWNNGGRYDEIPLPNSKLVGGTPVDAKKAD